MKKTLLISVFLLASFTSGLHAQTGNDTLIYLLTCGPGTEAYSIYGHSAIRIIYTEQKKDIVYNWGVFDFDTPNFVWKFAKGRLDYMLAAESMRTFLQEYFYEKRFVLSQKLNLTSGETAALVSLINENLRPENVRYRYDFFYDNCSTRIRDLIEKAVGRELLYTAEKEKKPPTFRQMIGKCQRGIPWLRFGIDLLLGSPVDKKADYRDRMFLPLYLQSELSESVVNRDGKMVPLLQNPETLLDFEPPVLKQRYLTLPSFVFTLVLIIVLIISAVIRNRTFIRWFDIFLFLIYSLLAGLIVFFNFFTDHIQLRSNFNLIWLNPVIVVCLLCIITGNHGAIWFRILFCILAGFLAIHLFLPQTFNIGNLPLILILMIRSSVRAGYKWNPLSAGLSL